MKSTPPAAPSRRAEVTRAIEFGWESTCSLVAPESTGTSAPIAPAVSAAAVKNAARPGTAANSMTAAPVGMAT